MINHSPTTLFKKLLKNLFDNLDKLSYEYETCDMTDEFENISAPDIVYHILIELIHPKYKCLSITICFSDESCYNDFIKPDDYFCFGGRKHIKKHCVSEPFMCNCWDIDDTFVILGETIRNTEIFKN